MNRVLLPINTLNAISANSQEQYARNNGWGNFNLKQFANYKPVFNSFEVFARANGTGTVPCVWFEYDFVDSKDLPHLGKLPINEGKIIKFSNHFFPTTSDEIVKDYFKNGWAPLEDFCCFSFYIQVQKIEGNSYDAFIKPVEGCGEIANKFHKRYLTLSIFSLFLLNHIDSRLKKENRIIKRLMPTPNQVEQIERDNKAYKSNPIYIKDLSVQYVYEPHESRKYQRYCESWGVRGHFRHYKSGKVIYISPYKKGFGKIKDTTYVIGG